MSEENNNSEIRDYTDLDRHKNTLIRDMFAQPADEAYAIARWCWLNKMYASFYWNALHSIEKYLKASLLYNGQSAIRNHANKNYGHDIEKLFQAVQAYALEFIPDEFVRPEKINPNMWHDEAVIKFVQRFNSLGDPNNRYNLYGYFQRASDIYVFDQLVFSIRRIAQPLNFYAFLGKKSANPNPQSNADLLRKDSNLQPVNLNKSWRKLSEVFESEKHKNALLEHNLAFAPDEHEQKYRVASFSAQNSSLYVQVFSPLERPSSGNDELCAQLGEWVVANVNLPKSNREEVLDAVEKLRARNVD